MLTSILEEPMLPLDPITMVAIVPDLREINQRIESPKFCIYECERCTAIPVFRLENFFEEVKQKTLNQELRSHGHKSSLIMPNGRLRLTSEGKQELYNHYITYHKAHFNL
jgi:hypothetical protein